MALTASPECTLKRGGATSSTDKVGSSGRTEAHGVTGQIVRVVDLDIKAGVSSDEGDGDDWPELRRKILGADIIILGTPIWLGQPSSVAKRFSNAWTPFWKTDEGGALPSERLPSRPWSAMKTEPSLSRRIVSGPQRCGIHDPRRRGTYWVGEAMGSVDTRTSRNPTTKPHRRPGCWRSTPRIWRSFWKANPYPGWTRLEIERVTQRLRIAVVKT